MRILYLKKKRPPTVYIADSPGLETGGRDLEMKEIGWSPLDVWAGFAHRKLMRSSGDSPQSGALSLECILGCWQNFSWATLAFDVESPFCFGVDVVAFPSEPRVEAGTQCNRRGRIALGGFVKDVGPRLLKPGLQCLDSCFAVVGGSVSVPASLPRTVSRENLRVRRGQWRWLLVVPGSSQPEPTRLFE